jgi:5-methyltetrahydropteroyltriglutamate--homocysteine methyltransferase
MLVTVVGNYPKIPDRPLPARLRTALARLDRGDITVDELHKVEDSVTVEVMAEQAEAGIELITDGQVRWQDEQTYIASKLGGISINGLTRFFDTNTYYREPVIDGAVTWQTPILVRDYNFAKENTNRPVKPVLTGPYTLARLSHNEHYGRLDDLVMDYARALNQEAKALQAAAPPLIQFNEPAITLHQDDLSMAEAAWKVLLEGLTVETAVYFYFAPPGRSVASAVAAGFTTVGVDATFPGLLDNIPAGKHPDKIALGVMDSRTTRLEPVDQIAELIQKALAMVSSDNLYVNPNQGLEYLPREQAKAKLVRLVEGVNRARGN